MNVFQELMKAGSIYHRLHSGIKLRHRDADGSDQPLLGSLFRLEQMERDSEGVISTVLTGALLLVQKELDSPVSRNSKFIFLRADLHLPVLVEGEDYIEFNFNDQDRVERTGVYIEIPIYSTDPIRHGPSDDYKRMELGR